MYNNRLVKLVAVVVVLMAVATSSGMAAASAPTAPERNVAASHCQSSLRQELGTVLPSGWSGYQEGAVLRQELGTVLPSEWSSGYQESDCSLTGARPAGMAALDNPNNQWIGPETVAAAETALKAIAYGPPGR